MATMTKTLTHSTLTLRGVLQKITRWLPSLLLIVAALLLYKSLDIPYWEMHLEAPQYAYRGGLDIQVFVNDVQGKDQEFDDLRELNALNHYIGMRSLNDAARLERKIAIPTVYIFMGLLVLTALVMAVKRTRWSFLGWLLALPALSFPFVFLADLYFWLWDSGQNLDPNAPFSSSIHPFTPPIWGEGKIGQFATTSSLGDGWYLTLYAAILIITAILLTFVHFLLSRRSHTEVVANHVS